MQTTVRAITFDCADPHAQADAGRNPASTTANSNAHIIRETFPPRLLRILIGISAPMEFPCRRREHAPTATNLEERFPRPIA